MSSVLILQKNGSGVNKLLGVLREHFVNRCGIIHIGKTVTVGLESIADLLELELDTLGLVEDPPRDGTSTGRLGAQMIYTIAMRTGGSFTGLPQ